MSLGVGGNQSKSKSERKNGGRTLVMKNRLVGGAISTITNNEIGTSGNYLSTKNGQTHKETSPLKSQSNKNTGNTILNSEERRKLFNTFMKEMNHSLVANNTQITNQNLNSSNTKKKRTNANPNIPVHQMQQIPLSESIQQIRGISTSSSRPRSQLAVA